MVKTGLETTPPSGVKIGLEMHQQLDTGKLFCRCPGELSDKHDFEFTRVLRPVISELGKVDRAALLEARRGRTITYYANRETSCAVEWDEEPPHDPDAEARRVAMQIVRLLNARPVDEVHFMRKILIDGSAVTGFQRTALIATDGEVDGIPIPTVCLEEDAARPTKKGFNLDRLGIPLIEVATAPTIKSGEEAKKVARRIGSLFRMARVRRGIGTIRQDLNVSIPKGARVEIKGVQDLDAIPRMVSREVARQGALVRLKLRFRSGISATKEVTHLFKGTRNRILKGKKIFAAVMNKSAGLFAERLHPGKHVGKEIAEYVRSFGHKGFMHSDEPAVDWSRVRRPLKARKADLIILAAGSPEVIELVRERVRQFAKGVPEDTRKALSNGSTAFMRPLPTGARMYPETDILPFVLPDVDELEAPEARLKRLRKILPEQLARKIHRGDYQLFERLGMSKLAGVIITQHLPALRRKGIVPTDEHIAKVIGLNKSGKLPKDGIPDALVALASGREVKTEQVDEKEVREFIRRLINKEKKYIRVSPDPAKGLMGKAMARYRGKVPGGTVFKIIKEEL